MPHKHNDDDRQFLQQAIELAIRSASNQGGPFGAVIVRQGKVIGTGHNQVTENCDPSAHAEVMAIRDACKHLNTHHLDDCTLYASCQPCPMCLSAIYWARIPRVIYAATSDDAASAGFDDAFIYQQLDKPDSEKSIQISHLPMPDGGKSFQQWLKNSDREEY